MSNAPGFYHTPNTEETTKLPSRSDLLEKQSRLLAELNTVTEQLKTIEHLEKPYVAGIESIKGVGETRYRTEKEARKKFNEYRKKGYYRNGRAYGVYLMRYNEDGVKILIENHPMKVPDFVPKTFKTN